MFFENRNLHSSCYIVSFKNLNFPAIHRLFNIIKTYTPLSELWGQSGRT